MEVLSFFFGMAVGAGMGRSSSSGSNPVSLRYALFATTEEEALSKLRSAYSQLYNDPDQVDRFDEDGDLVTIVKDRKGRTKEKIDSTISIDRFLKESLLQIKLYESDMKPIGENIMLARYLAKEATR